MRDFIVYQGVQLKLILIEVTELVHQKLLFKRVQSDCAAVVTFRVNSLVGVLLIERCTMVGLNLKCVG